MKITVDRQLCQGHAMCLRVAESLVDLDDEDIAVPLHDHVPPELAEQAAAVVLVCPERALALVP
jgi:ferredoxin